MGGGFKFFESAFIGNFIDSELNGDGIWISNRVKYVGQFVKDRFDGFGTIIYPDGIQYKGQWNKNEPGCMDCFIF